QVRIPIPWNQQQLVYCFAAVLLAARAVVEVESSSSWASCVFYRRPLGRRTQDSEECATPPAWTRRAFQTPSTRPPSVASDRLRSDYSDRARSRRRFAERLLLAPHSAQNGPCLRP